MAKMTHYVGKLNETNGEYSYTHTVRFKTSGDPAKYLARVASKSYDGKADKDGDGYYFNGGEVYVKPLSAAIISQDLYTQLADIVNEC